jgi:PAS domain-containing protein
LGAVAFPTGVCELRLPFKAFHYIYADGFPPDLSHSVEIGIITVMILGLTIVTALIDRRFSAQSLEPSLSEQRYRQLVESAQVILWRRGVTSAQFSFVNREAQELLGYPIEQWLASDFVRDVGAEV